MAHIKIAGFLTIIAGIVYGTAFKGDGQITATIILVGFMALLMPMQPHVMGETKSG